MFTGIVTAIGRIESRDSRGADLTLAIDAQGLDLSGARIGDSVAVSGVCLTITHLEGQRFRADVSRETLDLTTLGTLRQGSAVNLEPALKVGEALGGHLVSGHIDGLATLVARHPDARSERYEFAVPRELARYVARKGSVCLDGVSLTVNEVAGTHFGVNLIPHTQQVTTLGGLAPGARVNLEVDLIARYVERLSNPADG
jgi:riboflavin synthase